MQAEERERKKRQHFLFVGILIFCYLGAQEKISEPHDNTFWEKSNRGERRRKEKKKQAGAELCQAQCKLKNSIGVKLKFLLVV